MNENEIRQFISQSRWIFAKSMAKTNPHEYTLIREAKDPILFKRFVMHIRRCGYVEYFWRKPYTMFDVDGFKYWTMGAPLGETILINRKPLGQDESKCVHLFNNLDSEE